MSLSSPSMPKKSGRLKQVFNRCLSVVKRAQYQKELSLSHPEILQKEEGFVSNLYLDNDAHKTALVELIAALHLSKMIIKADGSLPSFKELTNATEKIFNCSLRNADKLRTQIFCRKSHLTSTLDRLKKLLVEESKK